MSGSAASQTARTPMFCGWRSLCRLSSRLVRRTLILMLAATQASCAIGYYTHVAAGQWQLLEAREPIESLLADPATDPTLKARLAGIEQARSWAVTALDLPANGSYTEYADLGRPYAVWNVYATPSLSLMPVTHCFPIAGCVAYQGFYSRDRAESRARELRARGDDVFVSGVPAYSTLGWFDDPVLNTMLRWNDAVLAGTLFHELAHQKVYVAGDTAFNESYASFVEQRGLQQYLAAHPSIAPPDRGARRRYRQLVQLVLATRKRLAAIYASPRNADAMAAAKRREFKRLGEAYRALRDGAWHGRDFGDPWFAAPTPNNARLLPFALYDALEPAFAALFAQCVGDWPCFHAAVGNIGRLPDRQRHACLRDVQAQAGRAVAGQSKVRLSPCAKTRKRSSSIPAAVRARRRR